MAKKKKKSFGNKVVTNSKSQKSGARNYGYLKLTDGISVFSPPAGDTVLMDILPYEVTSAKHLDRDEESEIAIPGEQWYKAPFFIHKKIGANDDAVVCLRTLGQKCPICEEKARMEKEGEDEDSIKELKNYQRNLYCIIPHDVEKGSGDLHVWDVSHFLFQKHLDEELEEDEENGDFPDPEDGKSLKVRFAERTFQKNTFAETSRIDFKKRKKPISGKLLKAVPKLDDMLTIHSYEKLESMLFELPEETEDKKDKKKSKKDTFEDTPKRKKKKADKEPVKEKKGKKGKKSECPEGYRFGKDTGKHDECDDCKLFDLCHEKYNS